MSLKGKAVMTYHNVAEIITDVEAARTRLCQGVDGLSSVQAGFKSAPDAWSVAEILEHLSKSEKLLVKRFRDSLDQAETAGNGKAQPGGFEPFSLDNFVERARYEKYKAPQVLVPAGSFSVPDILLELRASRLELLSLRPRFEARDVSRVGFPHPVFGQLNLYQWLAFVGLHEDRHLRQIESVMATPGFPSA